MLCCVLIDGGKGEAEFTVLIAEEKETNFAKENLQDEKEARE